MRILGLKPGHDGAYALIEDEQLRWSFEAEKDSGPRHGDLDARLTLHALGHLDAPPDVVAIGGWGAGEVGAGYLGTLAAPAERSTWNGLPVHRHATTHERSHILTSLAMSPAAPLRDAAVLVWEGSIGAWYRWRDVGADAGGASITRFQVTHHPGRRYASLFSLADPTFPPLGGWPGSEQAGKLMAIAGCADGREPSSDSRSVVDHLIAKDFPYPFPKHEYRGWDCYDAGVEDEEFARAARYMTDQLYELFAKRAREVLPRGLPLVIGGGCGLNCEWNTRLLEDGWFSDVFVPPCTDDSGSAIGAAIGAQVALGGRVILRWRIDAGQEFVDPNAVRAGWESRAFTAEEVADALCAGEVVAWVQGRCEIGPRALGHRSLLADPRFRRSKERLNEIKKREGYRPIAPICPVDVAHHFFDGPRLDPHMLYFSKVRRPEVLEAITHWDGTARVQALERGQIPDMDSLLAAFEKRSGFPILCNTSLNFPGRGFINRSRDLFDLCEATGIRHAVVDGTSYRRGGLVFCS